MEDFQGIAEESFPSFFTNSLLGNSEILENVTLSSNLGVPVAVSTLARNRSSADNRFPDVQSSYFLEGRFSVPSPSSPSCQSDTEPRERLKLSFQDDEKKNGKESPHLSNVFTKQSTFQSDKPRAEEEHTKSTAPLQSQDLLHRVSPLEQVPDSPLDFCLKSWMNNQEHKIVVPDAGKEDKTLTSDLSHVSFLENEKLVSLASLEDSSDDDINDEEFYDEHLQAYFEQLAIPGIIYEDLEGQESPEEYFKLPQSDASQANENSSLNSKSECNSSHHGSDSSRNSETIYKESEEAHTVCLPGTSNSIGTVDSRSQEDGVLSFYPSNWWIENERAGSLKGIFPDQSRERIRENIPEKTLTATSEKLNSIYFHTANVERSDFECTDSIKDGEESHHQSKHLMSDLERVLHMDRCSDTETPPISIKRDVGTECLMPTDDDIINSTNNLWSSNSGMITCECHESIEKRRDLSPNVVYQNEEGKWVTDLAYYASFDNKQDLHMSPNDEINEDFRSGSEALDLIARDEEEFNKEHQFVQAENIDVQNISATFGDSSWVATMNYNLLKKPHNTSEFDKDGASYACLSLGEFFAERSEALGCLGGGNSEKRPSFGYFIRSPEDKEPVALIQKSDMSRDNWEKEMTHHNQDQFSGGVNEPSQTQLSEGSVTLQAETLERTSQVDENDVTLTANEVKTEDTFLSNTKHEDCNDSLHNAGDSVLRISTIASAIADVSVSADPAQLVVMMKALRNKTRDKTSHQDNSQKGHSTVSHPLPNDLEKNNGHSVFDVEKYLKKTEVSRCEGGLEESSRTGTSDIWNLSLPKEQTIQDIHMVDSSATNVIVREPKENITAIIYDENGEQNNQEPLGTEESSGSVLTVTRDNERAVVDTKTCFIDNKLPDMQSNEKETSVSTPTSNSCSSFRNPRITSHCFLEEYEEIRENGENQRQKECVSEASSSDKHVTFEEQCVIPSESDGLKNPSLEHDGSCLEEDPESSRPSTSPSHSLSEISGTSLSRCALECLASIVRHEKFSSESELSRLACSHTADMSRLTYVSEQESTCPATTADSCPDDHKSDITSELSSTIMQSSLALSEEHAMGNHSKKVQIQSRRKGVSSCITQSKSDLEKGTETNSSSSKPETGEPDFISNQDPSSKSREPLGTSEEGLTSNPSELDLISLALLSKAGVGLEARSALPHLTGSSQKTTDEGQRVTSKDPSTASSESSGQILNQSPSGNQLNPPLCLTGHGSAAEMQNMPAVHPSLWTGHSLGTAPLAQQYLGTFPSTGNVTRPPCHAGSTSVCGCSYPSLAGEHVAMGICLGPSLASGLMGPSSFCNPCSNALHQNLLSTAKPFPVQSVGANCGIEQWDSGMMSRFGNVRVPEELKFPHACCIGIASQTHLSVLNPTDRWLQVSIKVLSVSVNGEKVDLSTYPCLVFKNKVIIRPHATEDIKILFIPSNPGIFRCIFSVTSWPFSADTETIVQAESLGSRVILTAIAEAPAIEVETEQKGVLDFGDLTYGGWKVLPLKVINRTNAVVPIRMIINANALAWRCFTFSKEPLHGSLKAAPYADVIAQLAAPSVLSHTMPASFDGQDPEFLMIWVLFHSPSKLATSSEILDSAEEFLARVDIELDSPNPTPILRSVSLQARAGVARIHAPRDLQTVHLLASVNSSIKQHLPLKNAGNIEVYLDIKVQEQGSHFSVDPENLFLRPGEEHEVTVSFTPKDLKSCEERILKIFVQPFGPQYEVLLKGEVISGTIPLPGPCRSDIPTILSNKQFLTWGGVPLGRTQLQKLALRSNCTSTTQHLRLLIRGQDQDCFQFQNTFGSEERLTSTCEIRIRPKEDIIVSVLFTPTRLSCMLAKLEIKQLGNRSQPGIKFMIPLSGYGGTSNLILEGVKKLSDSYMVTVNDLIPGKESKIVFSVRNTGSRAAFVKALGFKDSQKKILLDPKVLRIFPDKFVLKERTREDVTLIYNPSDRKSDNKTATELSTIYFFGGDEISRQQYRRALLQKPGIIKQILPEHSVLQNINFVEAFQDELLIDEVYDLPERPNDIHLFYGNMRKISLSVIGEFRDSVPNRQLLQLSSKANLESKSDLSPSGKHSGNISLDVLPVKGPQGSPFLSQTAHSPQDTAASEEMWTIHPEHLILVAPSSCDIAKTGRFQIANNSVRLLKFELYWPAHCLTVTPQHGFIAPESKLQILVSPNSSLSTKQSMFPWSGLIYIHCDNGQKKFVKVQIQEDLTEEDLLTRLASSTFGILTPTSEPPISHMTKPAVKPPSTKVELRSKMIAFPTTESGKTSENYLEFENHGPVDVKWHLSSFAPPYVKGVDESGDVFRATYTAFRCSPISGILESNKIQKVSITFLPRDRGDYAQFWDIECHPVKEPHMKQTLRFQLSGKSIRAENKPGKACSSTDGLTKVDNVAMSRKHTSSEESALPLGRQADLNQRGVYAPEDVYVFLPTRVGESRTLKVNLRNSSFITHSLKFFSPREPFHIKHSRYSLRARHYIHIPVHFRPEAAGRFEALLIIQTDDGKSVAVRLIGEALEKT